MLVRLGFLFAASIVAYRVKQILTSDPGEERFKHCKDEESEKNKYEDSMYATEKEEEDEVLVITGSMNSNDLSGRMDFQLTNSMYQMKTDSCPKKDSLKSDIKNEESELECLRSLVNKMEKTQEKLKLKLLVYYGLKQQEMEMVELKKHLKMKTVEINKLSMTMKALKVENNTLQEEITQSVLAKKQVDQARIKITELQKKIQTNETPRKGKLMMLNEQVASIQADEIRSSDEEIQKKLKVGKDLELEAMELKRRHKEYLLERRVMAIKLVVAEARLTAISNMTESEEIKRARIEADASSLANEVLLKQVEILQNNRFNIVEELVYQRWANACLRHEIQSYQTPSMESSNSDLKSVSSRQSSDEINEFYNTREDHCSSGNTRTGQKRSILHKLKRWRRSIDNSSVVSSLTRSFGSSSRGTTWSESTMSRGSSNSMGSMEALTLKNVSDRVAITQVEEKSDAGSPETSSVPCRRRRVSFNDSLNTMKTSSRRMSLSVGIIADKDLAYKDRGKMVWELEKPIKKKTDEVRTGRPIDDSNLTSSSEASGGEPLTSLVICNSGEQNIDESRVTTQVVSVIKLSDHIEESDDPRMPRLPDININDVQYKVLCFNVFFMVFLLVIILFFSLCNFSVF